MSAAEILSHLRADGLHLHVDGDRLLAEPRDLITDHHRNLIRSHKPALLTLLTAANDASSIETKPAPAAFKRWRVTVNHEGHHRSFDMLSPPERTQEDAKASAQFRFQERLVSVVEAAR